MSFVKIQEGLFNQSFNTSLTTAAPGESNLELPIAPPTTLGRQKIGGGLIPVVSAENDLVTVRTIRIVASGGATGEVGFRSPDNATYIRKVVTAVNGEVSLHDLRMFAGRALPGYRLVFIQTNAGACDVYVDGFHYQQNT